MPKPTIKKLDNYGQPLRYPSYEVFSPDGYQFTGGEHSRIAWDMKEAREYTKEDIEPCPDDCECRDEEN